MLPSFTVELFHGLRKNGACHHTAVLRDPTGYDEVAIVETGDATPVEQASRFLARLILRIGDCGPITLDDVLALTIGDRERLLLAASAELLGHDLQLVATCSQCGERAEITAPINQLIGPSGPASDRIDVNAKDGQWHARVRPPTGADLLRTVTGEANAARRLLTDCVVELVDPAGRPAEAADFPAECEADIAAALAELDRVAECMVAISCPSCATPIDALIDGFTILRAGLASTGTLYRDVFRMARVYRWSEAEILSLPLVRRRRYLAVADLEGERP